MMRALFLALLLTACGGGGTSGPIPEPVPTIISIPGGIVLDGPNQHRIVVPAGRLPSSAQEVRFRLVLTDYFRCNTNAHAGVMLHADLEALPGGSRPEQYSGDGLIFGRFGRSPQTIALPDLEPPVAVLEQWPGGVIPASQTPMTDGTYDVSIRTSPGRLGFSLGSFDSGDHAAGPVDSRQSAIVFFSVGAADQPAVCPWSIRITNLQVRS